MTPSNFEIGGVGFRVPPSLAAAACMVLIALLQLGMTWGKLDVPFYDGIIHYNFDNANFTYLSRNGISVGIPQTQFGLTQVQHSEWGVPTGSPRFYTHHPFLFKAMFQLFVRAFGDAEWVSRAFALAVSFIAATGVFAALWVASRDLLAALMGAVVLVSIPVFAMYQACLKYELDGMALGTWYFVAVGLFLMRRGGVLRSAIAALAAFAVLAHWTALIFVCCMIAWLLVEYARGREREAIADAAIASAIGAGIGAVLLLAVFAWLNGGPTALFAQLSEAAASRAGGAHVLDHAWFARQSAYVSINFGPALPWVAGMTLLVVVVAGTLRRRMSDPSRVAKTRLLPAFFFASAATALSWQFAFLQGSFVHIYWQLWFCVPVACLMAWSIVAARRYGRVAASVAGLLNVALAVHLYSTSITSYDALVRNQFGNARDVEFLRALRDDRFSRFVYIATESTRANEWFQGPAFEYYTDRAVMFFEDGTRLGTDDKILLLNRPEPWLTVALGMQLGGLFTNKKCGPRFCAYDFRPNNAEGGTPP